MSDAKISRKKMQSLRTREKILEAATTCFGEKGYLGCGMDTIAQAAGITKGAIYTHFSSKSELFIAIIEYAYKRAMDMANDLKMEKRNFVDATIKLLSESARNFAFPIDHKLWAEILAVASREVEVRKVFLRCQTDLRTIIEKWMAEGIQAKEIKPDLDIKTVSQMLFVLGNGLVVRLCDDSDCNLDDYFAIFERAVRGIIEA